MFDLISIGDIKLDTFIAIPQASVLCHYKKPTCELCIAHGKKIPVKEVTNQIAGSAPNVAIGVRQLNGSTAVMSTMGRDETYRHARRFLRSHNVSSSYLYAITGSSSSFSAVLNYQGESTQLVSHVYLPFRTPRKWPRAKAFYLSELGSAYETVFSTILKEKKKKPFFLAFNPGAIQIEENSTLLYEVLLATDLLFVNALEARILCNSLQAEIPELLELLSKKIAGNVIITDGKAGAYAYDRRMKYHAPMFPGERVEATGAGDAFGSGVLAALLQKKSLQDALAWGSMNAASVVQFIGPTKGLLTKQQLQMSIQEHPDYKVIPM